ncbi:helix-turn-helix domain-containing protein [Patescibacteria group bacterium]|nr:helix-turn-helix domain-containing protein [Patescibacteria group bacterium]MBU4016438.1 helix-turn-helix domain-containing protein [Patescibacteria group bacterium]MBU4098462.1 helix-turn-helix domain-containing protein [Patescibacteria group bacterium]
MRSKTKIPKALGRKIQIQRKKLKITQEKLAEKVGISRAYMGYIEQGRYIPSFKVADKIAKAFKVKVKDLISF